MEKEGETGSGGREEGEGLGSGEWGMGGGDVGREWEGLREVQEGRHSNGSPCCSEAELPLGKEIKCFLSISVGKVISDKLLQPRRGWKGPGW